MINLTLKTSKENLNGKIPIYSFAAISMNCFIITSLTSEKTEL